jgi:hypothetical protein
VSYQVTINGHCGSKQDEAKALDVLRTAVENLNGVGEVGTASASTQHHGTVDLKSDRQGKGSEE